MIRNCGQRKKTTKKTRNFSVGTGELTRWLVQIAKAQNSLLLLIRAICVITLPPFIPTLLPMMSLENIV